MITRTDLGGTQGDAGFPARDLRFDSGMANLATPSPTRLEPFPFDTRPPFACQPSKAVDSLDLGQVEIPESPGAVQASPTASVQSRHSDEDSSAAAAAATTAAIAQAVPPSTETDSVVEDSHEQERDKEEHGKGEKEWQETHSCSDGSLPSRLPDALLPTSTIQLMGLSLGPDHQSPEPVPNHCLGTPSASQIVSPTGEVACAGSGPCVSIQDITFLHIEGRRETVCEPEYLCVGKMWLRPGAGLPSDLLQVYRREVARKDRLATLRTRKCEGGDLVGGDLVRAARCSARKKVKLAQC